MMPIVLLLAAGYALVAHLFAVSRPWGGFCTFGAIAQRAALTQATSIGVFVVRDEEDGASS